MGVAVVMVLEVLVDVVGNGGGLGVEVVMVVVVLMVVVGNADGCGGGHGG